MMGMALTQTITLSGSLGVYVLIFVLILVLVVLCVILFVLVFGQRRELADMDKRLRRLMRGKNAANLENEITQLFETNDILTEVARDVQTRMESQEKKLAFCVQKMGLIKYDAFNQMGGKLSFALALLNEEDDGLVLNSVHSPEGNYTYVKEVIAGKSDLELAAEEQQALNRALAQAQVVTGERRSAVRVRRSARPKEEGEEENAGH